MGDSLMAAVFDAKLDKLERNRISAQKCRAKRKRLCRETEHRVNELSAENANLLENQRLKILLANAGIQVDTTDPVAFQNPVTFQAQQSQPKRIKYESGITHSYDSSESAVFASPKYHSSSDTMAKSQQMDFFPLAIMITILYFIIVATLKPTLPIHAQAQAKAPTKTAAPAMFPLNLSTTLLYQKTLSWKSCQTSCRLIQNHYKQKQHTRNPHPHISSGHPHISSGGHYN